MLWSLLVSWGRRSCVMSINKMLKISLLIIFKMIANSFWFFCHPNCVMQSAWSFYVKFATLFLLMTSYCANQVYVHINGLLSYCASLLQTTCICHRLCYVLFTAVYHPWGLAVLLHCVPLISQPCWFFFCFVLGFFNMQINLSSYNIATHQCSVLPCTYIIR